MKALFAVNGYKPFEPNDDYLENNKSWQKLLNEDDLYCRKFDEEKWELFYKAVKDGIVTNCLQLWSYHPYWREICLEADREELRRHEHNLNLILEDPKILKLKYGKNTTFEMLENIIKNLDKKTKGENKIKHLKI